MGENSQYCVAKDEGELISLKDFAKKEVVICGSYHLYKISREIDGNFIAPPMLSAIEDSYLIDSVYEAVQLLDILLSKLDDGNEWRSKYIAYLLPDLFQYFMHKIIQKSMNLVFLNNQKPNRLVSDWVASLPSLYLNAIALPGRYVLDFRSPIARNLKLFANDNLRRLDIEFVSGDIFGVGSFLRNLRGRVRGGSKYYLGLNYYENRDLMSSLIYMDFIKTFDQELGDLLFKKLEMVDAGFNAGLRGMSRLLNSSAKMPEYAIFNHVADPIHSGIVAALKNLGVKTYMSSHGAMTPTGSEKQKKIKNLLSMHIYNDHPGIEVAIPRSPWQISSRRDCAEEREKLIHYVSYKKFSAKSALVNKYFIGYAPNFLSWKECYHGLTNSCFETEICLRSLLAASSVIDDATFGIRIKTTVKDKSINSSQASGRGINPGDVQEAVLNKNVINCSGDSYSEFLSRSDLIVTEGVSSVVFDALEKGIPVLLLSYSSGRPPMIPAKRVEELGEGERSAVYYTSLGDDLVRVINLIKKKHSVSLSLDELSSHVWLEK